MNIQLQWQRCLPASLAECITWHGCIKQLLWTCMAQHLLCCLLCSIGGQSPIRCPVLRKGQVSASAQTSLLPCFVIIKDHSLISGECLVSLPLKSLSYNLMILQCRRFDVITQLGQRKD